MALGLEKPRLDRIGATVTAPPMTMVGVPVVIKQALG